MLFQKPCQYGLPAMPCAVLLPAHHLQLDLLALAVGVQGHGGVAQITLGVESDTAGDALVLDLPTSTGRSLAEYAPATKAVSS